MNVEKHEIKVVGLVDVRYVDGKNRLVLPKNFDSSGYLVYLVELPPAYQTARVKKGYMLVPAEVVKNGNK